MKAKIRKLLTVLEETRLEMDQKIEPPTRRAAATVIANAVDLPNHPAIQRVPANSLQPDSDLGAIPITRTVGALSYDDIETALGRGLLQADRLQKQGLIAAAALHLQATSRVLGSIAAKSELELAYADANSSLAK